jgi:hypothetical protein
MSMRHITETSAIAMIPTWAFLCLALVAVARLLPDSGKDWQTSAASKQRVR